MRALWIVPLLLAGCGADLGGEGDAGVTTVVDGAVVQPGHASCLAAIGREDVARDPTMDMSTGEITEFIECVGERARR